MRINHNIQALNAYRQLNNNQGIVSKHMEKLSSGLRINRASDDAAGLAISERMRSQIRGLTVAERNGLDGVSLIQTAEAALDSVHQMLQRMRELAVQSANGIYTEQDRSALQDEVDELIKEIDRVAGHTEFNTRKLLNGNMGKAVSGAVANIQTNNLVTSGGKVFSGAAKLVNLSDRAGNKFGVVSGDTVQLSFVVNGKLLQTSGIKISGGTTFNSVIGAAVKDINGSSAGNVSGYFKLTVSGTKLHFTAVSGGYAKAVYGITFTFRDAQGIMKTPATDALSSFHETRQALVSRPPGDATLQIGPNTNQHLGLEIGDVTSAALGLKSYSGAEFNIKINTQQDANIAIKVFDEAIAKVSKERSKLGAFQNRLEYTINNLKVANESLTAAESRIRDTDMAMEMTQFTKQNIISQSATAMLAQANQLPQGILQLLK
ncbi:flagellin protein [Heliomicrobium modesticaldum Ice1]|uniref:Flagellin n=1 Tax=Heliobacterium modesticaldum (strain ATCC 51547 / Ice1) TaxID=498761 RepID=B0TH01_HELMI|nr:flagellin [Heliomicrobium modesticaldum]ABZ83326.1 flagellin protein [Heliomicrobium modesticaldum Ice1]